jgi:hypothetical protein
LAQNQNQPSQQVQQPTLGQASKKQVFTEDMKRKIAEVNAEIEKQSTSSGLYLKFKDGETKTLSFDPSKTHSEPVEYEEGKPVMRWKYYVRELSSEMNQEKEWTVGINMAKELQKWIAKGYFVMNITRRGSDLQTKYDVDPQGIE